MGVCLMHMLTYGAQEAQGASLGGHATLAPAVCEGGGRLLLLTPMCYRRNKVGGVALWRHEPNVRILSSQLVSLSSLHQHPKIEIKN